MNPPKTAPDPLSGVDLFSLATRLDALDAAWARVRANGGCAGGDGVSIETFSANAPGKLIMLSRALRRGSYIPRPLRVLRIPKDSGETRRLAIPSVIDRIAQSAVAAALTPILDAEFEDESFAYRPGRSVAMAVAAVERARDAGFTHVVDGDIERFFDHVPHDAVLDRLSATLERFRGAPALVDLAAQWLEAAGAELDSPGRGPPQGSPLSPLLSNLHLDAIDEALREKRREVRLVRFADDFVLMCRERERAGEALDEIAELLREHGLRLNRDKTRIVDFDKGFRFLGHLFVGSMMLKSAKPQGGADDPISAILRHIARRDAEDAAAAEDARAAEESARAAGHEAAFRTLYVMERGRALTLDGESFAVTQECDDGPRQLIALPAERVERIEIGPRARVIGRTIRKLPVAGDVPALLGHEGAAAAAYWPALARCLDGAWARKAFIRTRRPAEDPVNACLSYLSALLARDVGAAVAAAGLHPGFGALHSAEDGSEACVFDLMEGFRAPLAEGLVVFLCNAGALKPEMFEAAGDGGVRIGRDARSALIRGYERRVDQIVTSRRSGLRLGWRRLMLEEARDLATHARSGGAEAFRPYAMDH